MSAALQSLMTSLFGGLVLLARLAITWWLYTRNLAAAMLARTAYLLLCTITPHLI